MRRRAAASLALVCTLSLAGCGGGGGTAAQTAFKPPTYDYLTKLRLNVGDIRIEDQTPPPSGPDDLAAQAPTPPVQAMRQMAQDRLVAAGNSGTAVFTIDQASITGQPGGTLDGTLAAHLDIIGPSGGHNGYAEAHVSREFVPGADTGNDGLRSQLYGLTNQMMSDMNVEIEYQIRRTLGDWLLDASGAPVGAQVDQQSLPPAGAAAGAPAAAGGTTVPAAAAAPPAARDVTPDASPVAAPSSASVGAPTQLAPPPDATPVGTPMQPPPSGPTELAPPPQSTTPAPAAAATVPAAAPAATAPSNAPPGFVRLPNGYLAPQGSLGQVPAAPAAGSGQATPSGY